MRAGLSIGCFVTFALLAACGEGSGDAGGADAGFDAAPQVAELLLGTAERSGEGFVPVADGDDVELVSGAQGGFHVWTTMRMRGAAGTLYLDREARRVRDGALVLRAARGVMDVPGEAMDEMWERPGAMASFMCPAPIGLKVYDEELRFTVTLLDEDENVLGEEVLTVIPRCPAQELEFCEDICAG